ncbi:MAG: hypothetical protein V4543_00885 [Bacteroidota bacterium]
MTQFKTIKTYIKLSYVPAAGRQEFIRSIISNHVLEMERIDAPGSRPYAIKEALVFEVNEDGLEFYPARSKVIAVPMPINNLDTLSESQVYAVAYDADLIICRVRLKAYGNNDLVELHSDAPGFSIVIAKKDIVAVWKVMELLEAGII